VTRGARPLHLVEVGVHWPPETFLRRKLKGLAAQGMRVTVAASLVYDGAATVEGVELVRIPVRAPNRVLARDALALALRSPRRAWRLARNLRHAPRSLYDRHGGIACLLSMYLPLARLRPDVVQFEWNVAAVDHLPVFGVLGCPIVTSCRGSDITVYPHVPTMRHYASGLPDVIRQADAVHCVSSSLLRDAGEFGLDPAKSTVIRPAVDVDAFRPSPNGANGTPREWRVVSVGWLRWEKGYEYAVTAIAALAAAGVPVRWELMGDVPDEAQGNPAERQRLLHTAADLGVADRIELLGPATPAQVHERVAAADAFLHASLAEGIPNVVLEAMACGLPVVTTDAGGVAEAVTDGVEGFVVPARRPERLAASLERLWRDRELAARMGAAGRERVSRSFRAEAQIEQFLGLYAEVTSA
jgi:glycosyltransferase involved in cell wall biosynthesis